MAKPKTTTPEATRRAQRPPDDPNLAKSEQGRATAAETGVGAFRRRHEAAHRQAELDVNEAAGSGATPSMRRRARGGPSGQPRPDGGAGGAVAD